MTTSEPRRDATALTRYIETRYHARYRQQLPDLVKLAEMVEDLHETDNGVPDGLTGILRRLEREMEILMAKEEQVIFPAIRNGEKEPLAEPITTVRASHDRHCRDIAAIRRLTDDFSLPEGACTPWVTLYQGLAEFVDNLNEHIRLESEVLFPQFDRNVPGSALV